MRTGISHQQRQGARGIARASSCAHRWGALVLVALLASLVLSSCGGSSVEGAKAASGDAKPQHGGMLTVGLDQQPECLMEKLLCGIALVTFEINAALFDGLLTIDESGDYAPQMADRVPTTENGGVVLTASGGMDVTVEIKPQARWSDGRPVTCEDARFTWQTMTDERWTITERIGWEDISDVECRGQRTAIYHFDKPYATYRYLLGARLLPAHVLRGKDFNTYWADRVTVSSGPFVFDHWTRSVEIVVKRNPNYWNAGKERLPYLDKLRWTFVSNTNTLKVQLRTGEVDLITPSPDSTLEDELKHTPRTAYQVKPDTFWENLSFNTAKWPTNELAVRKAIAYAIDREQIADVILRKQATVLDSIIMPSQAAYVPSFDQYRVDQRKARTLLEEDGWQLEGSYYVKDGRPLVVTFKTTAGNMLRLRVAQVLQQALKQVGIRMEIRIELSQVFFSQSLTPGAFNLSMWASSLQPEPAPRNMFSCDKIPSEANDYDGQNYFRWCDEHVTDVIKRADKEPDVAKRDELIREIQPIIADEVPVLPLYLRPLTIAYGERVGGIVNNPPARERAWNAEAWWKSS